MESEEDILLAQIKRQSKSVGPRAKPIRAAIKELLIKRGISDEQSALMTQEEWRKAVGPTLADESRPGNLKRGCLQVFVSNNLVLQELHFSRTMILKSLQAALPDFSIRKLRFTIDALR